MAKVSVIVPVYNTEKYLRRCLDTLVNQTLQDLEIVLINDGSTDGSPVILQEYAEKYPDKIVLLEKENGGQATARNLGIRKCTGTYVGFVDSDDYVDLTMFETLLLTAEQNECDMVECHYHYVEETERGSRELATRGNIRQYKNQKDMFINPMTCPWNKLIKRELLLQEGLEFPEGLIYEDTAFCIKVIPYIKKEIYVDKPLIYYILRGSSTMNANKSRKVADIFPVLENILTFYRDKGFYDEYKEELEYFCVKILLCSSLSRIGRVTDKVLQDELLDQTFAFIKNYFPEYKKNSYFSGKIGWYIKLINRKCSRPISKVLGFVMKG